MLNSYSEKVRDLVQKTKIFRAFYPLEFAGILLAFLGLTLSAVCELHAIAQWDLMFAEKMWGSVQVNIAFYQALMNAGFSRLADIPFQDGPLLRTTAGFAYDFFLGLMAFGWVLAILSTAALLLSMRSYYQKRLKFPGEWEIIK